MTWGEVASIGLRDIGDLSCGLPPCLFPFIRPGDEDRHPRYMQYNRPGEYHNGGIWPFVSDFYIAALTAAGEHALARQKLNPLASLEKPARRPGLAFGFNEWLSAQDCQPRGQDWQSWSAAMFLYAAECVEKQAAPFFLC